MDKAIPRSAFRLDDWTICPALNLLRGGGGEVHVEPKMMDVLTVLAEHAGEVVSKQFLADNVWSDVIITESVITRAIAGLRKALGDNAKDPRFIQTISKRGYRLLVTPVDDGSEARSSASKPIPYVVGQWVRGDAFYGRSALIDEIMHGQRRLIWVLGSRRIGKTSLLKQLEQVAADSQDTVPLFWDLQGAEEPEDLHLDFNDALLDAEVFLERAGIDLSEIEDADLFVSLNRLRRAVRARGRDLLVLCDEAEALLGLQRCDPGLLRKFRRAVQSAEGIRCVITASGRLWDLGIREESTSPFLDGFTPPLFIGALENDEARHLVTQAHLPRGRRPACDEASVQRIIESCGGHPYLTQMLCRRFLETKDVDQAIETLAHEQTVAHFLAVDMAVLSEEERESLHACAAGTIDTISSAPIDRLCRMGLLRCGENGAPRIANVFLEQALSR